MKKILLVGNGAREHAMAEALKRSPQNVSLIVLGKSKNPGIAKLADRYELASLNDFDSLKTLVEAEKPQFAVIGPENPLEKGIVDFLQTLGVPVSAPTASVARLETSKSFTRDLIEKYKIPGNPRYKVFTSVEGIKEFIEELDGEIVVKADGLTGGKGVKVMGDHLHGIEEAFEYAHDCLRESGRVVIEEKLTGQEFSLMSFTDGKTVQSMPPVQDHKRAFDGDKGPNTGGMGSYSCADHLLPFLSRGDIEAAHKINEFTVKAIHRETGEYYKGVIYGGFMVTKSGVQLIEYNARFGDPEAVNVLPILKTDYVEICERIMEGELDRVDIEFENKGTVCKYLVPEGYPDNPRAGEKIHVNEETIGAAKLYYSSVDQREDGLYLSSSRAIAVVGIHEILSDAERIAEIAISGITGPVFYRKDIGTRELIRKKVEMMKGIYCANLSSRVYL